MSAPAWFRHSESTTRAVNRACAAVAAALTVVIVIFVLVAVVARLMGSHILWPYDITQFALIYLVFLAMAPALESGHHVVVELFDSIIPRVIRPYVQHVAALLTLIFGAVFLYYLYRMTARAFGVDRLAVAAITMPLKWIFVIAPIGIVQFILTTFAELGRAHWKMAAPERSGLGH